MVKRQKKQASKSTIGWLIASAIVIELANVLVTWSFGQAQQDVCPKSNFPGILSILLGAVSLVPIIAVLMISKNKTLATALLLLWIVLVILGGYMLQFMAVGGLDWCDFLGR